LLANGGLGGLGGLDGLAGGADGLGSLPMDNPYEGYLNGAAGLTTANAEYQRIIQQAKLLREEAVRSRMDTRKKMIEQAEYERGRLPDAEKIRQEQLAAELDRARASPPLSEIHSARSLNVLLSNLIDLERQSARGAKVPLSAQTLASIHLTAGEGRGDVGLLVDGGRLHWPPSLEGEVFQKGREGLDRHIQHAVHTVRLKGCPDRATIKDLRANLQELSAKLDAGADKFSPREYIEARRYLQRLGATVTALQDPDVCHHFNGDWKARGEDVSELVQFMANKGLWFAPAVPGDEPAYLTLYRALAAYDAGMPPRMAGAGEERGGPADGK
jgi:hypothetical protein